MKISGILSSGMLLVTVIASSTVVETRKQSCLCGGLDKGKNPCLALKFGGKDVPANQFPRPHLYASEAAINQAAAEKDAIARANAAAAAARADGSAFMDGGGPGGEGYIGNCDGTGQSRLSGNTYAPEDEGGLTVHELLTLQQGVRVVPRYNDTVNARWRCEAAPRDFGMQSSMIASRDIVSAQRPTEAVIETVCFPPAYDAFKPINDLCHVTPTKHSSHARTIVVPAYPGKLRCASCNGLSGGHGNELSLSGNHGRAFSLYGSHGSASSSSGSSRFYSPTRAFGSQSYSRSPNSPFFDSSNSVDTEEGSFFNSYHGTSGVNRANAFDSMSNSGRHFGVYDCHSGDVGGHSSGYGRHLSGAGGHYSGAGGHYSGAGGHYSGGHYSSTGVTHGGSSSYNNQRFSNSIMDNEFHIGGNGASLSFDEQEKIYNGQNVPTIPADPVSVTLAYKNLAPRKNKQKRKLISEDRLAFGPKTIPADGRVQNAAKIDVPEEKLQIVDKPIVELKPPTNSGGLQSDDQESSDAYVTYSELGYEPVGGSGNEFARVPTEYATTFKGHPAPSIPQYDEGTACGPLGPPLPDYRAGKVIVHPESNHDDEKCQDYHDDENGSGGVEDSFNESGSHEEEDSSFEDGRHNSRSNSGSHALSQLWQKASHRRAGSDVNH